MTGPRRTGAERRGTGGWDSVLEREHYLVAPGDEWRTDLWRVAVAQFERAADLLGLDRDIRRRVREPRRTLRIGRLTSTGC